MDYLSSPNSPEYANIPVEFLDLPYKSTLTDKSIEKAFMALGKDDYAQRVTPSMRCAARCGNMYTASLYGGLASVLSTVEPQKLKGNRLSMYAFGSGCASSFFTLRVKGDTTEIREKLDLINRLQSMKVVSCQEFVDALAVCPHLQLMLRYI